MKVFGVKQPASPSVDFISGSLAEGPIINCGTLTDLDKPLALELAMNNVEFSHCLSNSPNTRCPYVVIVGDLSNSSNTRCRHCWRFVDAREEVSMISQRVTERKI